MCYCDPSNPFTGKSCGKEKCRTWEYQEAMRELTAERDALKAELDIEKNRRELAEEEIEVLGMNLDDIGLPRKTSDTLSIWGRVTFLLDNISSMRAELEAARKQEPDSWRVTSPRFCGTHTTDKEIVEHWMKTGEAYPLYASPAPAQRPESLQYDYSFCSTPEENEILIPVCNLQSAEVTPEMLRAAQMQSELGAIACSEMSGAYDLITELYEAMHKASLKGGENE